MDASMKNKLGIAALIAFAVVAAVCALLAPTLPEFDVDDPGDFLNDLEEASNYALFNFGFVAAFLLSLYGAFTLPDLLENTRGAMAARLGWLVYLPGAVLLIAFFAADGVFMQMIRVQYMDVETVASGGPVTVLSLDKYMNTDEIIYLGVIGSAVWIAGLALLAWGIYEATETPLMVDGPLGAGVLLLLISLFADVQILAALGYLAMAAGFAALGYLVMQQEDSGG